MKRFLALALLIFGALSLRAQDLPQWTVRLGYSPLTEDKLGLGFSYRPENKRFVQQLEVYPLQNRRSSIVSSAFNLGALFQSQVILTDPERPFQYFVGGEVYAYYYRRHILGSADPSSRVRDQVAQVMLQTGINYRIGKRIHLNLSLPLLGFEYAQSKGGEAGDSSNWTPAFLGFMGFFQPRIGIEVGLF